MSTQRSFSVSLIVFIVRICFGILRFENKNKLIYTFDFNLHLLPKRILHSHDLNAHQHQNQMNKPIHYPIEIMYDIYPFELFLYKSNLDEIHRLFQALSLPLTKQNYTNLQFLFNKYLYLTMS